jgi:hypothetical protein
MYSRGGWDENVHRKMKQCEVALQYSKLLVRWSYWKEIQISPLKRRVLACWLACVVTKDLRVNINGLEDICYANAFVQKYNARNLPEVWIIRFSRRCSRGFHDPGIWCRVSGYSGQDIFILKGLNVRYASWWLMCWRSEECLRMSGDVIFKKK